MPPRPSVPVRILTGALGAGKTTLINALLRAGHLDSSAIIVNEFGAIGIDHDLIERASDDVNLLAGGCLCCRVREDLVEALMRLEKAARQGSLRPFDRVVIETSGLAEPTPLLQLFAQSPYLQGRFHLDALVTVVDARLGARALRVADSTAMRQAVLADRLLVTKQEHTHPEQRARLRQLLASLNPYAPQAAVSAGQARMEWLEPILHPEASRAQAAAFRQDAMAAAGGPAHDDDICCFDIRWTETLPLAAVGDWLYRLASLYGERLLRVKGIIASAAPSKAYAVHVVQDVVSDPQFLESAATASRVVFITRGLEPNDVRPDWPFQADAAPARRRAPQLPFLPAA